MGTYLVRHIKTKEIQGIFWGSLDEIWDAMDELGDPFGFEYAALAPGALYTDAPIGKGRVINEPLTGTDPHFSWDGFTSSEKFTEQLALHNKLRWKPFDPANEGHGVLARLVREARG